MNELIACSPVAAVVLFWSYLCRATSAMFAAAPFVIAEAVRLNLMHFDWETYDLQKNLYFRISDFPLGPS